MPFHQPKKGKKCHPHDHPGKKCDFRHAESKGYCLHALNLCDIVGHDAGDCDEGSNCLLCCQSHGSCTRVHSNPTSIDGHLYFTLCRICQYGFTRDFKQGLLPDEPYYRDHVWYAKRYKPVKCALPTTRDDRFD